MTFVSDYKDKTYGGRRWGVETICAVLSEHGLRFAPSTYYEAVTRPPSVRALRDEQLRPLIAKIFDASGRVFGPRRVWRALNNDGVLIARCTVERLMDDMKLYSTLGRGRSSPPARPSADAVDPTT